MIERFQGRALTETFPESILLADLGRVPLEASGNVRRVSAATDQGVANNLNCPSSLCLIEPITLAEALSRKRPGLLLPVSGASGGTEMANIFFLMLIVPVSYFFVWEKVSTTGKRAEARRAMLKMKTEVREEEDKEVEEKFRAGYLEQDRSY